jgi:prepilin-type N-terminal cleavage/methylation domain-containing protein
MKKKFTFFKGFTLTELLIVIGVIGILASTVIVVLNPATQQQKTRDAKRKTDLKQIQNALDLYYNDNNSYPVSLSFGSNWAGYMTPVPIDPKSGRVYFYRRVNASTYQLYASLERSTDPQATACTGGGCTGLTGTNCTTTCNYGVSSSNTTP